ncbi:MAG: BrnA antitoxin family protein [Candidatus Hydrogenedentales bacterium]
MKAEYDLTKMKSRKNPYARRLKKQITLRLDPEVIEYFKQRAEKSGIPYQTLINLYLQDCRATKRDLKMTWTS